MPNLKVFENDLFKVSAKLEDGQTLFNVEEVARSLGITTIARSGNEVIRWSRVNDYLPSDSPQVAKGDFIPEPLVYKLAFKAKNDIAEKFQDWLAIEVIPSIRKTGSYGIETENLSPELQMFNGLFQSLAKQELATKQLESKVDNISEIVALNTTDWRKDSRQLINKMARLHGGYRAYQEINNEIYQEVERRGSFKLSVRLTNKRRRLAEEGISKSKRDNLSKIDVIADDKRLVEIYIAVVKEFAIKYGIEVKEDVLNAAN